MRRLVLLAVFLFSLCSLASAQSNVQWLGPVTAGNCITWFVPGIIKDAGIPCVQVVAPSINIQSGNYTIASSDCGKTIAVIGAQNTITLPAASGFPLNCIINVTNASTSRAQILSGFPSSLPSGCGVSNSCLWPQPYGVTLEMVNSAWVAQAPPRWKVNSPTFYVDPAGTDLNDCLAPGVSSACLTIQHAIDLGCGQVDAGNTDINISLANGTYINGAQLVQDCVSSNSIQITGNSGSPGSVIIQSGANPWVFAVKDKGFLQLNGMTLRPTAGTIQELTCGQYSNIDLSNVIFNNAPVSGNLVSANDYCTVNFNSNIAFTDNAGGSSANAFLNATIARIQVNTTITVNGTWTVTYSCSAQGSGGNIQFAGGGGFTLAGGASVTGQKWLAQLNGAVWGGAAQCPGTVAGVPAVGSSPYGGQAQ